MSDTCLVLTRRNTTGSGDVVECGGQLVRDWLLLSGAHLATYCLRCGDVRVVEGVTPERSGLPPDPPLTPR